jgi:hypothetical protein
MSTVSPSSITENRTPPIAMAASFSFPNEP